MENKYLAVPVENFFVPEDEDWEQLVFFRGPVNREYWKKFEEFIKKEKEKS